MGGHKVGRFILLSLVFSALSEGKGKSQLARTRDKAGLAFDGARRDDTGVYEIRERQKAQRAD